MLSGVVERLEKATGPDRELDDAIMAAIFVREERHTGVQERLALDDEWVPVKSPVWVDPATDQWVSTHARQFTSSADAALTLVPKDYDWIVGNVNGQLGGTPYACVGSTEQHFGATPIIALCVAALKARA